MISKFELALIWLSGFLYASVHNVGLEEPIGEAAHSGGNKGDDTLSLDLSLSLGTGKGALSKITGRCSTPNNTDQIYNPKLELEIRKGYSQATNPGQTSMVRPSDSPHSLVSWNADLEVASSPIGLDQMRNGGMKLHDGYGMDSRNSPFKKRKQSVGLEFLKGAYPVATSASIETTGRFPFQMGEGKGFHTDVSPKTASRNQVNTEIASPSLFQVNSPIDAGTINKSFKKQKHNIVPNSLSFKEKDQKKSWILTVNQIMSDDGNHLRKYGLFQPVSQEKNSNLLYPSIFIVHELLGRHLIIKNQIILPAKFECKMKTSKLKDSYRSQTIKSLVSFIDLMHEISHPPLYASSEKLKEAQNRAVKDLSDFWDLFDSNQDEPQIIKPRKSIRHHPQNEQPQDQNLVPAKELPKKPKPPTSWCSTEEWCHIEDMIKNAKLDRPASVRLSNKMFLLWMRKEFNHIYQLAHKQQSMLQWKSKLISVIHHRLLSSKKIEELLEMTLDGDDIEKNYFYGGYFQGYIVKLPFKIDWPGSKIRN